jgi:hypothetical protein
MKILAADPLALHLILIAVVVLVEDLPGLVIHLPVVVVAAGLRRATGDLDLISCKIYDWVFLIRNTHFLYLK